MKVNALLIIVGALFAPCSGVAELPPPNVLLIMTDDQGYGDFSIHGNPYLKTPEIDRLARASVRFDRFYVNSFCAPTRAALLTGRWPLRTGCHGVTHNREAMRPSEQTLAEVLHDAQYRTACIGKWHNGEQCPYSANGQGFEHFFGFNNGHWNAYFNPTLLRNARPEPTQGYISDVLTDEAIRFIDADPARPFFCYLAYNAPHSPFQVPDAYFDRFKNMGLADDVAAFYGMCENLDENIGRLLRHLDSQKRSENTIVLFLTDNGGTAGVKLFNAGMRGGKTSVHEGGNRVPLFVRWPAARWESHVVPNIASHIDLFPTVLDLCGITAPAGPALDGVSLRPLLESPVTPDDWPQRILFTHNPIDEQNRYPGAVRTDRYRLVREIRGRSGGSAAVANDATASDWQLYDMHVDPGQKHDVATDHPDLVREFSEKYEAWMDDQRQVTLQRFPLAVGYPQQPIVELHAPQAFYDRPLHFASGPGFANDWLTNWSDADAKVWFDLEVARAGRYQVEVALACPPSQAGSVIRVRWGNEAHDATVPGAPVVEIPLPHRDEKSATRYRNRQWNSHSIGAFQVPAGKCQLSLEVVNLASETVMDLKHVRIEAIE